MVTSGQYPKICISEKFSIFDNIFSGDSGDEEEVNIEKWDQDTIVQFLDEKIMQ
jgi:hypothetical protein